jgi:hypothetical protein
MRGCRRNAPRGRPCHREAVHPESAAARSALGDRPPGGRRSLANDLGAAHGSGARFRASERLRRWVIVVVVAILANLAIDAYNPWRSYRFVVDDVSQEVVNFARILAAQTEGTLKSVDVPMREVGEAYSQEAPPPATSMHCLRAASKDSRNSVADDRGCAGRRTDRSASTDVDPNPSILDRSYFIAQRDNPDIGLFVGEPIITRTTVVRPSCCRAAWSMRKGASPAWSAA